MAVTILLIGLVVLVGAVGPLFMPVRVRVAFSPQVRQLSVTYMGIEVLWDWIGGFRRVRILGLNLRPRPFAVAEEPGVKPTPAKPRKPRRRRVSLSRLWSERAAVRRIARVGGRFLRRIWRSWRLESGRLRCTFGSGDPATTGLACAGFWIAHGMFARRWPALRIEWQPDFTRSIAEVDGSLTFRITPIRPVAALLAAAVTFPWRGVMRLRRA
jgi:hypothetical protein